MILITLAVGAAAAPPRPGQTAKVYRAQITPHWFHQDTQFWYRNDGRDETKEFILVDIAKATRLPAFDHPKLAAALSKAAAKEFKPERLPFQDLEFIDDGKAVQFNADGRTWKCDLASYVCDVVNSNAATSTASAAPRSNPASPLVAQVSSRPYRRLPVGGPLPGSSAGGLEIRDTADSKSALRSAEGSELEAALPRDDELLADPDDRAAAAEDADPWAPQAQQRQRRRPAPEEEDRPLASPDAQWTAFIKEHNVYVRSAADGKEYRLSQDGRTNLAYGRLEWAPDSQALVGWRLEPGDRKPVYLIRSSPPGGGRAVFETLPYELPGDKLAAYELSVFDVAGQKQIKPPVDRLDLGRPRLHWNLDRRHFTYEKVDRGHQRFRIIEVDAHTGESRNILDEKSETFINTSYGNLERRYLEKTDEIIYTSERDGWKHLYLIDLKEGRIRNQITRGEWVVRGVDRVDEEQRQVWFQAGGLHPTQDPYLVHFCRINFDGTGLVVLTEGNGNHTVQYSPDRKHLIDTYSRADLPPVHKLRRASDGQRICDLETADVSESGWVPPEVFVAKGRDGKTDIWGLIFRPPHLDRNKKYAVIEDIYAGPHSAFVPKAFSAGRRYESLTSLGFIVVKIDGMGTGNRSKAFLDVCWHNLKDAGFPDRILWMQAAAENYPYMDLTRVGVYGTSAGGQSAAGAVLFHPEFYKAAVANCGCHDNRMDKAVWNEQWMGYPVGPWYAECSNIDNAHRLRGKLFLIVGELDKNVPPESTFRLVDALLKAEKDFDLLVVPGGGHGSGGAYGQRRLQDFFVRHLQGVEPPDRNSAPPRIGE